MSAEVRPVEGEDGGDDDACGALAAVQVQVRAFVDRDDGGDEREVS